MWKHIINTQLCQPFVHHILFCVCVLFFIFFINNGMFLLTWQQYNSASLCECAVSCLSILLLMKICFLVYLIVCFQVLSIINKAFNGVVWSRFY